MIKSWYCFFSSLIVEILNVMSLLFVVQSETYNTFAISLKYILMLFVCTLWKRWHLIANLINFYWHTEFQLISFGSFFPLLSCFWYLYMVIVTFEFGCSKCTYITLRFVPFDISTDCSMHSFLQSHTFHSLSPCLHIGIVPSFNVSRCYFQLKQNQNRWEKSIFWFWA